jgi:hypothetical protein
MTFGKFTIDFYPPGTEILCSYLIRGEKGKRYKVRFRYLDLPNQPCEDAMFIMYSTLTRASAVQRRICGDQSHCDEIIVTPTPGSGNRVSFLAYFNVTSRVRTPIRGFVADFEEL